MAELTQESKKLGRKKHFVSFPVFLDSRFVVSF
jgi:hypothetical protein